jgi:hypothetical protein
MRKTQIFSLLFFFAAIALGFAVYRSVKGNIEEAAEVKRREELVINRLKEIREAQKLFLSTKGRYAGTFDSLKTFVLNDEVPNVERKETIIKGLQSRRPGGGDSIKVTFDTLGREKVSARLFPKQPDYDVNSMDVIPGWNDPAKKFSLFVGKITQKGGTKTDVIEVVDVFPYDKRRKEDHPNRKRRFLRFGAKDEVTTTGNWED